MNPLTVKIFKDGNVKHLFLDMCSTSGQSCGTSETIFCKMDQVITKHNIPWENCIALSVDNASVNMGVRNSLRSRITTKNPATYVLGCPCHILHTNASKAADSFSEVVGFDVEDLCVDLGYWFDKSSKRKGGLQEFCEFCDSEYKEVLMHTATRWLSLQKAIDRCLKLFQSLKSYFLSSGDSTARGKRLVTAFRNPMTEVYLLFLQSVLPIFTRFNLLLQRSDPAIHILYPQMYVFLKSLLGKFLKPELLCIPPTEILSIDYKDSNNYLDDSKLNIGLITRSTLRHLFSEGDISEYEQQQFHKGVLCFYISALDYATSRLPLKDRVLENAQFTNVTNRLKADFMQVFYFAERYDHILGLDGPNHQEELSEEFIDYQTMTDQEIPANVWKDALTIEEDQEYHRMDVLWGFIDTLVNTVTGKRRFKWLSKIAKLVLTLPHSNADEERVFSFVKHNKTPYRDALNINSTLSSILTVKMASKEPCFKFEPTSEVLTASKKATWSYNQAHVQKRK